MTQSMQMTLALPQSGSIESYVQSVFTIPMLSADEERALAERLYNEGDLEAAGNNVEQVIELFGAEMA